MKRWFEGTPLPKAQLKTIYPLAPQQQLLLTKTLSKRLKQVILIVRNIPREAGNFSHQLVRIATNRRNTSAMLKWELREELSSVVQ